MVSNLRVSTRSWGGFVVLCKTSALGESTSRAGPGTCFQAGLSLFLTQSGRLLDGHWLISLVFLSLVRSLLYHERSPTLGFSSSRLSLPFLKFNVYFIFERERESVQVEEGHRERGRGSQASSMPTTASLTWVSNSRSTRS